MLTVLQLKCYEYIPGRLVSKSSTTPSIVNQIAYCFIKGVRGAVWTLNKVGVRSDHRRVVA